MPLVSPVTVPVRVDPLVVVVSGCQVVPSVEYSYPVTAEPPSEGAVKVTVALALPGVALSPVGAAGAVAAGVTLAAAEGAPVPTLLTARTATWSVVPLIRSVIVPVSVDPLVVVVSGCQVVPSVEYSYPVTAEPPSEGAVKVTVALALPGVALSPVGAAGAVAAGVTLAAAEGAPVPTLLTARTLTE